MGACPFFFPFPYLISKARPYSEIRFRVALQREQLMLEKIEEQL